MNTEVRLNAVTRKWEALINGKVVCKSAYEANAERGLKAQMKSIQATQSKTGSVNVTVSPFSINERFDFVTELTTMVATRATPSAIITGQGGLGKSFTVVKALNECGLEDKTLALCDAAVGTTMNNSKSYTVVKGYSTAKGLYRTLYENKDSIVVFDDCDSILKDAVAVNLLKAALDSYSRRIISYNADIKDDDLPRTFEFTGGIVFISNMSQEKFDTALKSRSMNVDLSMTTEEKIERMEALVTFPDFMPEFTVSTKKVAIETIKKYKDETAELSLRSLIKVTKIVDAKTPSWEKLARYVLANS